MRFRAEEKRTEGGRKRRWLVVRELHPEAITHSELSSALLLVIFETTMRQWSHRNGLEKQRNLSSREEIISLPLENIDGNSLSQTLQERPDKPTVPKLSRCRILTTTDQTRR